MKPYSLILVVCPFVACTLAPAEDADLEPTVSEELAFIEAEAPTCEAGSTLTTESYSLFERRNIGGFCNADDVRTTRVQSIGVSAGALASRRCTKTDEGWSCLCDIWCMASYGESPEHARRACPAGNTEATPQHALGQCSRVGHSGRGWRVTLNQEALPTHRQFKAACYKADIWDKDKITVCSTKPMTDKLLNEGMADTLFAYLARRYGWEPWMYMPTELYQAKKKYDNGKLACCEAPPEMPEPIHGCTDASAENFNPSADTDDGSCRYGTHTDMPEPIHGCTDASAENFNPSADTDDGSCRYGTHTMDPPVNTDSFSCGNGTTIQARYRCDGFNDCGNNADELGCAPSS